MNVWKYHQGEWTQIEDPMVWGENEDWETVLKRAGYYSFPSTTFGLEPYCVEVYTKTDYTPPYLIAFSVGDAIEHVYIDDVPSLMQWLRDYTPHVSLQHIADNLDDLLRLFERAFRAWHGHPYESLCPICAPEEWERTQKARAERLKKRPKAPLT